jgi:hypothetical protein
MQPRLKPVDMGKSRLRNSLSMLHIPSSFEHGECVSNCERNPFIYNCLLVFMAPIVVSVELCFKAF